MASLKLMYFNSRGRAEVSRMLLALAGAEYEDYRFADGEWPKMKPTTPLGQAPILVIGGDIMISQSHAIERYIARRFDLYGKKDSDMARVDMVIDTVEDIFGYIHTIFTEKDEAKKAETQKKIETDKLPGILDSLEKLLKENKDGDGYFVGDSITVADVNVAHILESLTKAFKINIDLSSRPKLKALVSRVFNQPKIAEWVKKRPDTKL